MTRITERLFYRIAKRWIAGYTLQDAMDAARNANERKIHAILNRLGEHTPDRQLIQQYVEEYLKLLKIIARAEEEERFVWIDMENSPYTESTVEVYRELLGAHKDLGLCLQANMKRTENDLKDLLPQGGKIRLVKGAYPENGEVAFKRRSELNANYLRLMHILFEQHGF